MRPAILPVIHYANDEQAIRNAELAFAAGSAGVFLIHMDGDNDRLPPVARQIKARWPDRLVGINFLGADPAAAVRGNIHHGLDMTWIDLQITHSAGDKYGSQDIRLQRVQQAMSEASSHLLFAGVALKHQMTEPRPDLAAKKAIDCGFIPTTSGPATGIAADAHKVARLREIVGPAAPLAIASGITPRNVHQYARYLSHILVSTGVSSSFYEFDPEKLCELRAGCSILDAA